MKIVHFIDSFLLGGAEVLLKNTIELFPENDHFIVYLRKPDDVLKLINPNVDAVCLEHTSWKKSFSTINKLRKLIEKWQPDIVHAHLFESTLLARFAVPRSIPLVSTLHSTYSIDAFQKNKKALCVEKLTAKKQDAIIAVSKFVLDDYLQYVSFNKKTFVLHNFLPSISPVQERSISSFTSTLKCVAVGNLKEAKNYPYLIEVFDHLKALDISLDIYGDGALKSFLQEEIDRTGVKVKLCGKTGNVKKMLTQYDLFIQASSHEGYGISVAEAMIMKVPTFLSDIAVFREITNEYATFFPLSNSKKAAEELIQLKSQYAKLKVLAEEAYKYITNMTSEKVYKQRLNSIYKTLIESKRGKTF